MMSNLKNVKGRGGIKQLPDKVGAPEEEKQMASAKTTIPLQGLAMSTSIGNVKYDSTLFPIVDNRRSALLLSSVGELMRNAL